ncbi:CBO0543 family protein [Effusibacillus consociatus]|uniref:CBO0543 family protein n=1 Tax=Effusibacillus consociatus TaxID=1117041 RepID=A0ABV9PZY7_9BACL
MHIAKHWKKSNLPFWPKKRSFIPKFNAGNAIRSYVPTMIFSSWLGTYADLILVEKKIYSFPVRPFPDTFKINIAFTLFLLPIMTAFFVYYAKKLKTTQRAMVVLSIGILMPLVERIAEKLGWFVHGNDWRYAYSLFGYILFMWVVWRFHLWHSTNSQIKE